MSTQNYFLIKDSNKQIKINNIDDLNNFIAHSSDIYETDISGQTLLHYICSFGTEDMIIFLAEKYPSLINSKSNDGSTPLHSICSTKNKLKAVEYLINKGADINAMDKNKYKPFHYAIKYNNLSLIDMFIAHGAYVDYMALMIVQTMPNYLL